MGDAVGHDAHRPAGHAVAVERGAVLVPAGPEIGRGGADENPGPAAADASRGPAGILDRGLHDLQQDALLWVHFLRFARGEIKGSRIELADVADGAGGKGVAGAGFGLAVGGFRA